MGDPTPARRWLGLGWKLAALWGVLYIALAVYVPVASHLNFPGPGPTYGPDDERFTGAAWPGVVSFNRDLGFWVLLLMDTMCAMMMGLGVLTFQVARRAYRRGERWAWQALLLAHVLGFFYFAAISLLFVSRGITGFSSGVTLGPVMLAWAGFLFAAFWLPRKELAPA